MPDVGAALKRYVEDLNYRRLARETIRKIEIMREELVVQFSSTRIDQVLPDELSRMKEAWKFKPSAAAKKLERVRAFFKFCIERHWIEKNPAIGLQGA